MNGKNPSKVVGRKKSAAGRVMLAITMSLAIVFVFAPPSHSSLPGWSDPQNLSPTSTENNSVQIAVDSNGNPHAVWAGFEQLIRPAIRKMMGHRVLFRPIARARLQKRLLRAPGMRHFIPGRASLERHGGYCITPLVEGDGSFLASIRANALIVFPEDREELKAGEKVQCQLL